jgi:DNA-binding MarR family transcriptional regulator
MHPAPDKTETRPTPPLEQNWLYKVAVLADRIARHTSQLATEAGGLNLSQWRVLVAIADRQGRTASEVVELTPMDKGIVSRAVTALVARGHLRRQASETDARRTHLYLTETGQAVYDRISTELQSSGAHPDDVLKRTDITALNHLIDEALSSYPAL